MKETFDVQGMTCGHCARAVTEAVRRLDPQAAVEIDLQSGRVVVQAAAPRERVAEAIREEGYTVAS
jgi:copper chaperone